MSRSDEPNTLPSLDGRIITDDQTLRDALRELFKWADDMDLLYPWANSFPVENLGHQLSKVRRALIGVRDGGTHPDILHKMSKPDGRLRVLDQGSRHRFTHAKLIVAYRDNNQDGRRVRALLGSSNFTKGGFCTNEELNILIEGYNREDQIEKLNGFFKYHWEENDHENAKWNDSDIARYTREKYRPASRAGAAEPNPWDLASKLGDEYSADTSRPIYFACSHAKDISEDGEVKRDSRNWKNWIGENFIAGGRSADGKNNTWSQIDGKLSKGDVVFCYMPRLKPEKDSKSGAYTGLAIVTGQQYVASRFKAFRARRNELPAPFEVPEEEKEDTDIFIEVEWLKYASTNIEGLKASDVVGKERLESLFGDAKAEHLDLETKTPDIHLPGTAARFDPKDTEKWRDLLPLILIAMAVTYEGRSLNDINERLNELYTINFPDSEPDVHPFWEWFEGRVQEMNLDRWLRENDEYRNAIDPPEGLFES